MTKAVESDAQSIALAQRYERNNLGINCRLYGLNTMSPRTERRTRTAPVPASATTTVTATESDGVHEAPPVPDGTLRLRGAPVHERRVVWAEDVVDNEGLGRKSSKGVHNHYELANRQSAAYTTNHGRWTSPRMSLLGKIHRQTRTRTLDRTRELGQVDG